MSHTPPTPTSTSTVTPPVGLDLSRVFSPLEDALDDLFDRYPLLLVMLRYLSTILQGLAAFLISVVLSTLHSILTAATTKGINYLYSLDWDSHFKTAVFVALDVDLGVDIHTLDRQGIRQQQKQKQQSSGQGIPRRRVTFDEQVIVLGNIDALTTTTCTRSTSAPTPRQRPSSPMKVTPLQTCPGPFLIQEARIDPSIPLTTSPTSVSARSNLWTLREEEAEYQSRMVEMDRNGSRPSSPELGLSPGSTPSLSPCGSSRSSICSQEDRPMKPSKAFFHRVMHPHKHKRELEQRLLALGHVEVETKSTRKFGFKKTLSKA